MLVKGVKGAKNLSSMESYMEGMGPPETQQQKPVHMQTHITPFIICSSFVLLPSTPLLF
jgi:hypothetical protein